MGETTCMEVPPACGEIPAHHQSGVEMFGHREEGGRVQSDPLPRTTLEKFGLLAKARQCLWQRRWTVTTSPREEVESEDGERLPDYLSCAGCGWKTPFLQQQPQF